MDKDLLSGRISDAVYNAQEKYMTAMFGFCDEQQQNLLLEIIRSTGFKDFMFWGGYKDAERKCLGIFPGTPEVEYFPISFIKFTANKFYTLSHRDYMGSLLACGIKREILGDISIIDEHSAYAAVFDQDGMARYICDQVTQIGRAPVKTQLMPEGFIPDIERKFEIVSFTVSSVRLDSVVAGAVHTSRSSAAKLIAEGKITLNHAVNTRTDATLKSGDVFSVYKKGKFVVQEDGGLTKKDKIRVNLKKYL